MKLDDVEILCYEYLNIIRMMQENPGMHILDGKRKELHDLICKKMDIDRSCLCGLRLDTSTTGTDLYLILLTKAGQSELRISEAARVGRQW